MTPPGSRKETTDAPYRIKLALDRTMLAWVRTALAMASFGFALAAFFRTLRTIVPTAESARIHQGAVRFGTSLLLLGVLVLVVAGAGHWRALRQVRRGEALTLGQWPLSITLGLIVAVIGVAGLWFLFHR
jgi:putative membrane protein